jgi:hypothetical protein
MGETEGNGKWKKGDSKRIEGNRKRKKRNRVVRGKMRGTKMIEGEGE